MLCDEFAGSRSWCRDSDVDVGSGSRKFQGSGSRSASSHTKAVEQRNDAGRLAYMDELIHPDSANVQSEEYGRNIKVRHFVLRVQQVLHIGYVGRGATGDQSLVNVQCD